MRVFFFLPILLLLLISCDSHENYSVETESFTQDTAAIHAIFRKVNTREIRNKDTAFLYLTRARVLSESIGYSEGFIEAKYEIGNFYDSQNRFKEAFEQYKEGWTLAEKHGLVILQAKCLEQLASLNLEIGDSHLAMKQEYEALLLFEKADEKEGIARVYNIVGVNKSEQGQYDSAIVYFNKAIELNLETGNQQGIIHNKANLAFTYYDMGKIGEAKAIYADLIPQLIQTGDSINLSVVYYHFSLFSQEASQPDSTLFFLRKALSISEKLADTSLLTTLYGKIGQILLNRNQTDSATYLLTKSVNMAKAIDDYITQRQALKLLLAIDTLKGDYKKAVQHYDQILIMNDSVYQKRIRNSFTTSELRYENQKKDNLIQVQKIKLSTSNRQKRLLVYLFSTSILLSFLLIFLIVTLKKNNKKKHELLAEKLRIKNLQLENALKTEEINNLKLDNTQKELKIKEKELVSNALAITQKNEILGLIQDKINEARKSEGILTIDGLNGIVSAIKVQLMDNDPFNEKFNQLHHGFFENLKNAHPDLSKTEIKFCAYLKLNLSSNQISQITNVTTEAIRKTRYRIRKKLNLEQEESLEEYISRF